MKPLSQYILESKFKGENWVHNNTWSYAKAIVNDLLSGKEVKTIVGPSLTISDFDEKKLKDLASRLENVPERTTRSDLDDAYLGKLKRRESIFLKIEKSVYSGHTALRQSQGEAAESLVCYLFNNDNSDHDFQDWIKKSGVELDNSWKVSSQGTVKLLNSRWSKKSGYEAVHVDGRDFDTNLNQRSKNFAIIFKSKTEAKKILGYSISDMYQGKKDKWNPADILLINKTILEESWKTVQGIAKDGANGPFGEPLNNVLSALCESEAVVPVSLKKCVKEPKLFSHAAHNKATADNFENSQLLIAGTYAPNRVAGTCWISAINDGVKCMIQSRGQSAPKEKNLSIEAHVPNTNGSKTSTARAGKGISLIKSALKLNNNDYYAQVNSNEDLIKGFEAYGFDLKLDSKMSKLDPPAYKRTCFIGLLGILQNYAKYLKSVGEEYLPDKFAEFLWIHCTECPGAYYIVHD